MVWSSGITEPASPSSKASGAWSVARSTRSRSRAAPWTRTLGARCAAMSAGFRSRCRESSRRPTPPRVRRRSGSSQRADAAEVVVPLRPAAHRAPGRRERLEALLVDARLGVHDLAGGVHAPAVDGLLRLEAFVEDRRRDADEGCAKTRASGGADREHE